MYFFGIKAPISWNSEMSFSHPYTGLALFEDKVYWIDSDTKKLSRANKFNGYKRTEYKENLISPMDLVIYHPSAQKKKGECEIGFMA